MELNAIDYRIATNLACADLPFSALLAAAMIRADPVNYRRLQGAFPDFEEMFQKRCVAPNGILDGEAKGDWKTASSRAADIAESYLSRLRPPA